MADGSEMTADGWCDGKQWVSSAKTLHIEDT